jgi:CRISPR/Cas system-associated exonuclease Cas4 (RecB family)
MSHMLSKSKYIRGLQCDRALWLDVHNPRLAKYTREQMQRFDRGRDFEYAFKATFPDGIDLSAELKRNVDAYPERTAQLIDKEEEIDLFEAGFSYDDVLVLADVVHKRPDGSLDIYEVKSGNNLSETYRRDAALQHYVISHCREIHTFSIVYANPAGGFIKEELSVALQEQHEEIEKNIAAMKEIIRSGEPATPTGQHCLEPYACPYQHYCAQGVRQMSLFG